MTTHAELFASWPEDTREPSHIARLSNELRLDRCREPLFPHQVTGVATLLQHPYFALFDDMGLGKSLQTIVTAQLLFERGLIDRVIVVAPATVRPVWFDEALGELTKHLFLPALVSEYHAKFRQWRHLAGADSTRLRWIITNYDFIRSEERYTYLQRYCGPKTLLVLDESSAVKGRTTQQTKACFALRYKCGRVLLLNGTPIPHSPLDLFTQGNIMDPRILECKSYFVFRSRYAVLRPNSSFPQVIGWQNLDDLQRRFKPYVLRRLKEDVLSDLPPKLPAVVHGVTLTKRTWGYYKEMRDDMVAWLDTQHVSVAAQAVVKVMRLAQLTSGFVGGVETEATGVAEPVELPEWFNTEDAVELPSVTVRTAVAEVGREKLDYLLSLLSQLFDADPTVKVVVWCRFRPEYERAIAAARLAFPGVRVSGITGKQRKAERTEAVQLLDPRTAPQGNVVVFATAGHKGLNLTAASVNVYLSHDPSLDKRKQSEDRTHRLGQTRPVSVIDLVAYGPEGQKTWDHVVLKARREKEDVATWTSEAWKSALIDE